MGRGEKVGLREFLFSPFGDPTDTFSALGENPRPSLALYSMIILGMASGLAGYLPASRTVVRIVGAEPSVSQAISSFQRIQGNPLFVVSESLLGAAAAVAVGGILLWLGAAAAGGRLPLSGSVAVAGAATLPDSIAQALRLVYYGLALPDKVVITVDLSGGPFGASVRRSYSDPAALRLMTSTFLLWEGYLIYAALTSSGGERRRSLLIAILLTGLKAILSLWI